MPANSPKRSGCPQVEALFIAVMRRSMVASASGRATTGVVVTAGGWVGEPGATSVVGAGEVAAAAVAVIAASAAASRLNLQERFIMGTPCQVCFTHGNHERPRMLRGAPHPGS